MFRTNAMVLQVRKPKVAGAGFWEVLVGYQVARRSVLVLPECPSVGDTLPEGVVTWVKPDDEKPGYYAIGVRSKTEKLTQKRTIFTNHYPEIGDWVEACFL